MAASPYRNREKVFLFFISENIGQAQRVRPERLRSRGAGGQAEHRLADDPHACRVGHPAVHRQARAIAPPVIPRPWFWCLLATALLACPSGFAQSPSPMQAIDQAMKTMPKSNFIPPADLLVGVAPGTRPLTLEEAMDKYGDRVRKQQGAAHPPPSVLVFVSFSVPQARLASYVSQVRELDGALVLRGFHEGSLSKTTAKAQESTPKADVAWMIHPDLFRQFHIDKVPTILIADNEGMQPTGEEATTTHYAKVEGDVSVEFALRLIKERGNHAMAALAAERLDNLRKARQ